MNEAEMASDEDVDDSYTNNQLRVSMMQRENTQTMTNAENESDKQNQNNQSLQRVRKMATSDVLVGQKEWMMEP